MNGATNLMIDIETLGAGPKSGARTVILTAAGVWFDPRGVHESTTAFDVTFDVQAQLDNGRLITADTLKFWLAQKPETLAKVLAQTGGSGNAVYAIPRFIDEADTVWANGPDFDCTILADYYKNAVGYFQRDTWPFWKHRCVRTFTAEFSQFAGPKGIVGHTALEDCYAQVGRVQNIYRELMKVKAI